MQDTNNVLLEPRVCVETLSDHVAVTVNNCDNRLGQARSQNEHEKHVRADGVLFTPSVDCQKIKFPAREKTLILGRLKKNLFSPG